MTLGVPHPIELDALLVAEVRRHAEGRRPELIHLCGQLVAARSHQPGGDTTVPAAVLTAFLRAEGLSPELRAAVPEKPNVVCAVGHDGPHLVLNGHLDTLSPGDERDWAVPAFTMGRADGRLTGLGIGNMKAGVAALAMAFAFLARRPDLVPGRVTFTAVADEVTFGPHGAAWLLKTDAGLRGDALINAEGPGACRVAAAEKGLLWAEITAWAGSGQGMLTTRGSSAVARLASVLTEVDGWNDEQFMPPAAIAAMAGHAGQHGLRLSANVGKVAGGDFISQVATSVRAEIDFRLPPGVDLRSLEERLDQVARRHAFVRWRTIKGWDPNWTSLDSPVVAAVTAAASAVRGGADPAVRLPASDAARWRALGVPAVCFGPQPELASGIDDYVNEQDVVDCVAIYVLAAVAWFRAA